MTTEEDKYIYGALRAGVPPERLAGKLNTTSAEIQRRYDAVTAMQESFDKAGVDNLAALFETTCLQHQLLGEGLKLLGANLSQPISPEEIRRKLTSDPDQTVKNLMSSFIILRPFEAPSKPSEE